MKYYFDEVKQQEVILIADHEEIYTVEDNAGNRYHAKSKSCTPLSTTCFSPVCQAIEEPAKEVPLPVKPPVKEALIEIIKRSAPAPTKRPGAQIKLF